MLTDRRIRETSPADKPVKLTDGGGMYLLVRPDGARYWRLDYRFDGKRKTLALGVYPEVSLAEARKRRSAARALLASGEDPGAAKKAARRRDVMAGGHAYALEFVGEGVWSWDVPRGTIHHNGQWARLMGLDEQRTESPETAAIGCLHDDDRGDVMAAIQACLDGESTFDYEHRVHRPSGVIWVQNRGEVVERDADGKPLRMIGSMREITAQKRAGLSLQRRNALLQATAAVNEMLLDGVSEQALMTRICEELVRDGLFHAAWIGLVNDDGATVRRVAQSGFNAAYLDTLDIRCDDSPQGQGLIGRAIRTGATVINEDTETSEHFAQWRERARLLGYRASAATPVRVHGRVVGALSVYTQEAYAFTSGKIMLLEKLAVDLGVAVGNRMALAALRESEERFRLLLDSSPEAIYGVDTQGVCTFVNAACLRMLGYAREEMLGRNVHELIHHTYPDGRPFPREHCHVRAATLEGHPTHVDTEVHWRKDGTSFPVEYWSHPMYRGGDLVGAVVAFIDISERKRMEQALRESEERYRLISSVATDLLYSCVRTREGFFSIDWATATVDRIFGYTLEQIMERGCWRCFVHPEDVAAFDRNITYLEPDVRGECELRIIAPDGGIRYVRAYSIAVASDGGHRLYGACQDITDYRRAEEALRESEARFRALAEHSTDWIWCVDNGGRHTYSNACGAANLGYSLEEFLALDALALVHPDDRDQYCETFERAKAEGRGWRSVMLRWRHRDGSYRTFESSASPLLDDQGELIGFQGVDRDITERRQAEERIEFLAHHDVLTGLPNRVLLRDRFDRAIAQAKRSLAHVAMLFLDLDHFKVVNDTLGHAAGDTLLQAVVARLAACTRNVDTISRQGGDEFIVLLTEIPDAGTVERIAGDILQQLAEPVEIGGHALNTSGSIGVAMYPDDGHDFDTLLQKADTAMYNAKDAGRNTYRFFDERMNAVAHEHLMLQNRLYQAIYRAELYLLYQPQLDVTTGKVTAIEALLRWTNAELGEVSPTRFIPVAEDSGLIVPIGAWVIEQACRQAQVWRNAGLPDMVISVNLSALQFRRMGLIESVSGALERTGLPPHLLELELTESILLQDVENTLETVRDLKALGVRLAIDDFGTGYSSLSYLKRFAVDRLKIDQSFVRDITTDADNAAIVRAVIQLANSLRLGTVAEGVETAEQLAFLREAGCRDGQGYLFAAPLPPAELEAFLHSH